MMKRGNGKRLLCLLLCLAAALAVLGGCGAKDEAEDKPRERERSDSARTESLGGRSEAKPEKPGNEPKEDAPKGAAAYQDVLQAYYDALYADWYEPLTAEKLAEMGLCPLLAEFDDADRGQFGYYLTDLNGDGADELLLGYNNDAYADTIYALYTTAGGTVTPVFTASDFDSLYLREDGTLVREGMDDTYDYYCALYRLDETGYAVMTEALLNDDDAGAPYLHATESGNEPMEEDAFWDATVRMELGQEYVTYTPLAGYFEGGQADGGSTGGGLSGLGNLFSSRPADVTQLDTSGARGSYFTHETFYDSATGAPAAQVLVPYGWTGSLSVNWNFVSTDSPGVGEVTLQSPDGQASITITSNQAFVDITANGIHFGEGPDSGLYVTQLYYRNAQQVQELYLTHQGFGSTTPVQSLPVSDSLRQMIEEAARVKLQASSNASGITAVGCEGTVAHNLYQSGGAYLEYVTFVTAAHTRVVSSHVTQDMISWNVPASFILRASSREAYERWADTFAAVVGNSSFTAEFLYLNIRCGAAISDAIHEGLMAQSEARLRSDSASWRSDYESSSSYTSDDWANQWSDVIYERNEYATTDGGTVKVDTKYDTVYQDGDLLYMGPSAYAPDGWTELSQTY